MARQISSFIMDDGKRYIFKKGCIDSSFFKEVSKNQVINEIKALIEDISVSTIRGWLDGRHGPSDKKSVEALAKVFGRDVYDFLEVAERNDVKMKIDEYERKVARGIYGEMLEMIQLIKWEDPLDDFPSIRAEVHGRFDNQEEAREHYLLAIRKTSLDLPVEIRAKLVDLVECCFGPFDIEYNEMYFNSPEYKEYLKKNDWHDNCEARYKYSATFRNDMTNRLNEILSEYKKY